MSTEDRDSLQAGHSIRQVKSTGPALIECPDCKAQVSKFAAQCPGCGRRYASVLGMIAKGLFLIFNGVMLIWFIVGEGSFEVMLRWAAGAVILGMLALVTRDRWSERHMDSKSRRPKEPSADRD